MRVINHSSPCAFVVGGSTGIGRAIAQALLSEGIEVVIFSRSDPLASAGLAGARWWPLDLSRPETSRRELDRAVAKFGQRLIAVFYSAVYYGPGRAPLLDVPYNQWRDQLNINLNGLWHTLSATLPALMTQSPGLFVGISSEVVYNAGPHRAGYAATKAGAASLLQSVAQEYPESHLRVVQLLPAGMVDTPGIRRRREVGFDYSAYMDPASFQAVAVQLVRERGAGLHGCSLVVDAQGHLRPVSDTLPPSQSRRPA